MIRDIADADLVHVLPTRYGPMMCLKRDWYIGHALQEFGEYSESEVDLWRQLLRPDAICVDAGANLGSHTVALASLVPAGLVVSVEPLRFLYHMLCGNVALNGLTNVVTYHAALGAARGTTFVPPINYTVGSAYGGLSLVGREKGNPVAVLPLDEMIGRVDFLKADVEGMELSVLQGAVKLIEQWKPILYVENNYDEEMYQVSPKQQQLIDFIHALGYDLWWHHAPHFNPDNFHGNTINDKGNVISVNMLGLPVGSETVIAGLEPISKEATLG